MANTNTQLSKEAISSYKELYFLEHGIKLSDEEAELKALQLLRGFKVIFRPIPKELYKVDTIKKR